MELFTNRVGTRDDLPTIVFLHGLFGQGKNFGTAAKALSDEFSCVLVDLPNHGHSPHTPSFDYEQMAKAVATTLTNGVAASGPVHVVGHSMGGKVAMCLALEFPELVDRLVVEDISPVDSGGSSEFDHLLGALRGVDLATVEDRGAADAALAQKIPSTPVRQFLLQNLRRKGGEWKWLANLDLLHDSLRDVMAFPHYDAEFPRPTLWMGGATSDYIRDEYEARMEELFPKTVRVTIKNAGHWIHSEQPEAFVSALRMFFTAA